MFSQRARPFPVIVTERLELRRPRKADADYFFMMVSDPVVQANSNVGVPLSRNEVATWTALMENIYLTGRACSWTIVRRKDATVMGCVRFNAIDATARKGLVGYELLEEHRDKGYMTEALKAVVSQGADAFGLIVVEAVCDPGNRASIKVLQRSGFHLVIGAQQAVGLAERQKTFSVFRKLRYPS